MNSKIKKMIDDSIQEIINNSSTSKKLNNLEKKHEEKLHFIPKQYRIFGGLLQSMNIQFGNFIEILMSKLVENEERYEIISKYSGNKSNKFLLSLESEKLIDNYITECQIEYKTDEKLQSDFKNLLINICSHNKDEEKVNFQHDIDLLFRDKKTNIFYYLEIKFNDDHDTGKFIDINRKFIKTYGYLLNELGFTSYEQLVPILFFFNNKRMKGNPYIPEDSNIRRGQQFFNEFLSVKYEDIHNYLENISQNKETIKSFEDLYTKVVTKSKP